MKAEDIFLAALERKSPAERAACVEEACGNDAGLRAQVESLLQAHQEAGSFLNAPLFDSAPTIDQPVAERPGTQIGPYKLLQQIGEGGFGVVFMAEQAAPVKRRVALKVIKPGMDTRQVIARFEAERQALAVMDHPNIARVMDAGATQSGRPYFVMELVRGTPITNYCDENSLTIRERLELFDAVCQAIQHAHTKGIIHRDIKPTNVMVTRQDGRPVVKVIDFGIAKAMGQQLTEKTLFTDFAQMIGTPLYMSPEQAELSSQDIDTRSDIYSLGVLLYELLTGSTPVSKEQLKQAAFDEIRRIIREDEPQRPSNRISTAESAPSIAAQRHTEPAKLARLVRGELDWIVMKALEKDRSRRYETPSGLATDIQHYLQDEPVLACPPSAWYRFRKFARRNQARLITGGTLAVATLVIASVVAASLGWTARERQFRRAKLNHEVELAIDDANRARDQALALTDNPYQWEAALASAGSAVKSAHGIAAQDESALALHLRDRLKSLQADLDDDQRDRRFAARFDAIRLEQSELNPTFYSFRLDDAYPAIRDALQKHYQIRIGVTPDEEAQRVVRGRPKAIQHYLLAALELAQAHVPPTEPAAKKWLSKVLEAVDSVPWRRRVVLAEQSADWPALTILVNELAAERQPPSDLLRLAERAPLESPSRLAMFRRIQQVYPADFWANHQLASCLHRRMGPLLDEAVLYYAAAHALRPHSVAAALNLGDSLRDKGDFEAALQLYRDTLQLHPDYDLAHFSIGWVLMSMNRLEEAETEMRKAIGLRPDLANGYWGCGVILERKQRHAEAETMLREGLQRDPNHYWCHSALGDLLLGRERFAAAEAEYRELLRLDPKNGFGQIQLGRVLQAQEKFAEAEATWVEAVRLQPGNGQAHSLLAELRQKQGTAAAAAASLRAPQPPEAPRADPYDTQLQLGMLLRQQKKFAEAEVCLREAVRLRPNLATAHYELGLALDGLGQYAQAEAAIREAMRLSPTWTQLHGSLGWMLLKAKNPVSAEAVFRESLRLVPHPGTYYGLGQALRQQNKIVEAQDAYREALRLNPSDVFSHRELGWIYLGVHRLPAAEAEFRAALAVEPESVATLSGLANAFNEQQNYDAAEATWRSLLRIDPAQEAVYNRLAAHLRRQKKWAEAEAALREGLCQNPESAQLHNSLGWVLREQAQFSEAEAELRKAVQRKPENGEFQFALGSLLADRERPAESIAPLRAAIQLVPDHRFAYGHLGWSLIKEGQFREAEHAFQNAIRVNADNASAHFGVGRALFEQQKFTAAEAALREALKLDPAHRFAPDLLDRALVAQGKPPEAKKPEPPK